MFLKLDLILSLTAIIPVSYKQVTFIAERVGTVELIPAHLQGALNNSISSREYVAHSVIHISVIQNETPACREEHEQSNILKSTLSSGFLCEAVARFARIIITVINSSCQPSSSELLV